MQCRRLFKGAVGALQTHRHAIATHFNQAHKLADDVHMNVMAKNVSQVVRFFSSNAEGDSVKDKRTSTVVENGAEAQKESNKSNGSEPGAKSADISFETSSKVAKPENEAKAESPNKDLQNLLKQKQALLKEKDKLVLQAKQEVLTYLAEVENVRGRTRRDADSIKKHAVETFASELLDMADTLGQASANVSERVRNEALTADSSANAKLLKSLFEGVDMTEKQLMKIFNKFGVQKFDPVGERFDANQHLAITEVDDESKEPQTIVNVVKSGYFFNDKLIRPAEVTVVKKRAESK